MKVVVVAVVVDSLAFHRLVRSPIEQPRSEASKQTEAYHEDENEGEEACRKESAVEEASDRDLTVACLVHHSCS